LKFIDDLLAQPLYLSYYTSIRSTAKFICCGLYALLRGRPEVKAMEEAQNQHPASEESKSPVEKEPQEIDENDPALLMRTETRSGRLIGDVRVRRVIPNRISLRRLRTGVLAATEATQAPRSGIARIIYYVKRALIGAPIATAQAEHERLTKFRVCQEVCGNGL
jgi:hypothetical protein